MPLFIKVIDTTAGVEKIIPYDSGGVATTDASKLTAGILADARLSTNVVLKSLLFGSDGKIKTELYNAGLGADLSGYVTKSSLFGTDGKILSSLYNSTGGTSGGKLTFTGDGNVAEIFPANYNLSLKQGKFNLTVQEFKGVNGTDPRSNVVLRLGYNQNSGGGKELSTDATMHDAWESYYDIGGSKYFERHVAAYTLLQGGEEIRPLSFYLTRGFTGGAMNMQVAQSNWKLPEDKHHDYATIKIAANNAVMILNPKQGGQSSITLNGRLAKGFPNQDQFNHSQVEFVTTGEITAFYSSVPFHFNKSVTVEGDLFIKKNGRLWKLIINETTGAVTAV